MSERRPGQRLRLCIVTREYPPVTSYSGGIGSQFAALAPELARHGHEVHVVTLGDRRLDAEREGVALHLLRPSPIARLRPVEDLSWARAIERALPSLGSFDALYAAEWRGEASVYARRKRSGPLVTNLASGYRLVLRAQAAAGLPASRRQRVRLLVQDPLERRQAERSDALVAPSQAILAEVRGFWDIDGVPAAVLPNAIELGRLRRLGAGEPPPGFPGDGPVVAFSGRLQANKGAPLLVEAMRTVWRQIPAARLVLLGRDEPSGRIPMSDRLRTLAGENVGRLHLLGSQPGERLFPALARADVVAAPSLWEAFGLAALEAMALGRPTVVTSGSGYEEFVDHGRDALMVPPGDPAALAEAVLRLLEDGALAERLGREAAVKADAYDVARVAPRHAAYLEQVASGDPVHVA